MPEARVFVPLQQLDDWLSEGWAELTGDVLTVQGQRFAVGSAVRFLSEVAGGADELSLVGRVKSSDQLVSMEAEHTGDSVVLGDNAYHVLEGYVLSPEADGPFSSYHRIVQLFSPP